MTEEVGYKELYEAGCKTWGPVFEAVLNERDALRQTLALQWRGIDSAPKDTAILVWHSGYTVAHFNTFYDRWIGLGRDTIDTMSLAQFPPTHWMPLPTPPASSSDTDAKQ